jgi:16S rRNA G966 N2-methylase RsmD
MTEPNLLYYGDNLDVLRQHMKDESVDLVYLDPPFNSNASYNVLFAEHGAKSASQIHAFEDTVMFPPRYRYIRVRPRHRRKALLP